MRKPGQTNNTNKEETTWSNFVLWLFNQIFWKFSLQIKLERFKYEKWFFWDQPCMKSHEFQWPEAKPFGNSKQIYGGTGHNCPSLMRIGLIRSMWIFALSFYVLGVSHELSKRMWDVGAKAKWASDSADFTTLPLGQNRPSRFSWEEAWSLSLFSSTT